MSGNDDESKKSKSDKCELETALETFKGKCNKFHVIGHKAVDCPKKKDTAQAKASEKAGAAIKSKNDKSALTAIKLDMLKLIAGRNTPRKYRSGQRT